MVRLKYRYFAVEIKQIGNQFNPLKRICNCDQFAKALKNLVAELHGDYGVATIQKKMKIKYFCCETHVLGIRVSHGPHRFVASSIPFMKEINGFKVAVRTIHVAATLRKMYSFINNHYKGELEEALCLRLNDRNVFCESKGNET